MFYCGLTGGGLNLVPEHFDFPPVVHDWVNKGLGYMSLPVCAAGQARIQRGGSGGSNPPLGHQSPSLLL